MGVLLKFPHTTMAKLPLTMPRILALRFRRTENRDQPNMRAVAEKLPASNRHPTSLCKVPLLF